MKKKKLFIIFGVIIILIIIGIVITIIFQGRNEEKVEKELFDDIFLNLVDNNYKYFYYMYGDIQIDDGYIEENGTTYYHVNDEKIMSLEDFDELVNNTFVDAMLVNLLEVDKKNQYINVNGEVYVNKLENPCTSISEYDFDNLRFKGDNEKKYVYYEQIRTEMYNEDGIWKLGYSIYRCNN